MQPMACARPCHASSNAASQTPACRPKSSTAMHRLRLCSKGPCACCPLSTLSTPAACGGRIAWFVLVGTAAAAVHWGVVVMLVAHAGWRPLLANVLGWLSAFGISFSGHHRWTFRDHGVPLWRSAMRFFAVSAVGFSINEGAYALLWHWSGLRYDLVLALVLIAVAGGTYFVSRHWAFNHKPER